jgi:hypothetical protein
MQSKRFSMLLTLLAILFMGPACATSPSPQLTAKPADESLMVSTACGEFFEPPVFSGLLVYLATDGSYQPIADATFWRGIGPESLTDGSLRLEAVDLKADGSFSARVGIRTSDSMWTRGGTIVKSESWVEDVVFKIRALGCDPLVVHFAMDWQPKELVMQCPGRVP